MAASYSLGTFSLFLGWLEGWDVVGFLCVYFVITLAYSLRLKKYKWLDLIILASVYTLRVLTGAATSNTAISGWLIGFVFLSFVALAVVKRLTELKRTPNKGRMPGRGYVYDDFKLLGNIAVLCLATAVLMFLAYSFTPVAATLYSHPILLQLVMIPNIFWMFRMIRRSQLGQGDYDPVYFAVHDKTGLIIIMAGVALTIFAI
jgi:4-hydroxybenzoate polyprenyltransferase